LKHKISKFQITKKRKKNVRQQIENLKRSYQALSVGVAGDCEGSSKTLAEQLTQATSDKNNAETELKSCNMRLEYNQKEISKVEYEIEKSKPDSSQNKEKEKLLEIIEKLNESIKKLGFSPLEEQALVNEKKKYGMLIRDREERIEKLKSKLSNFELQYKDPIPNFDRSRVKGLVLNFFELVDPKFSIALEVAGGGKLWNIIVDNEETASLIFKNGNLNRTVTFLPLTKMKPHLLSESQINEALSIAPGEVNPALSLIKYDEQYAKAVEYVFGNVFICNSLKIAETITFDPNIKAPTVTTDGDIFDPSGTATGGSRPQSDNVLERISELKTQERELTDFIEKLNRVEERLQMIEDMSDTYRKLNLELELKTRELEYLQQRISQTPYNQLLQRYEEIKESILKEKKK